MGILSPQLVPPGLPGPPQILRELLTADRRIAVLLESKAIKISDRLSDPSGRQSLPFFVQSPLDVTRFLSSWCGVDEPLDAHVADMLLGRTREVLQIAEPAKSVPERLWQAESERTLQGRHGADEFARLLAVSTAGSPAQVVRETLDHLRARGLGDVERLEMVAELWGGLRPIVIMASSQADQMAETIRWIAGAVEVIREMRLVVVADSDAWSRLQELLDSHTPAILRDGLSVCASDPPGLMQRSSQAAVEIACEPRADARAGRSDPGLPTSAAIENLRDRARGAVRVALQVGASAPSVQTEPPAEYAAVRSLAEALLYAALQADAATTGLFVLNADGGFMFGNRKAEIDLLCPALSIAIEVDGYFHFQDKEAYRRDRAKDWLMQRQGMAVLRFLAEDVPDRLEMIVGRVIEVVQSRRSRRDAGAPIEDEILGR